MREKPGKIPLGELLDRGAEDIPGWLAEQIRAGLRACLRDGSLPASVNACVMDDHDAVVDALVWEGEECDPLLRFGSDGIERLSRGSKDGARLIVGLGVRFCLDVLNGMSEREALEGCLDFLNQCTSAEQEHLLAALWPVDVDVGGVFERFVRDGLAGDAEERARLSAWLLARAQIELPYEADRVRRALSSIKDLGQLRQAIYSIIHETFRFDLDTRNAERIARWCREGGIRLVGGRFSRAFYLEAMLAAGARVFDPRILAESIQELDRIIEGNHLNFLNEDLRRWNTALQSLGGEKQALLNLLAEREVSTAQVDGAINNFLAALRSIEQGLHEKVDEFQRERRHVILEERRTRGGISPTWRQFQADRSEIVYQCDQLRVQTMRIEEAVAAAPKRDPAFVIFFQRLFPLDAINIGTVNEFVDPFFGEDENVRQLIRDCGHRMYITPNLSAWLRHCEDWIEALPAYASYTITPRPGGGYDVTPFVQRGILEDMFRRHADDWALNIEEVMRLENVALAREMLAESLGILARGQELADKLDKTLEEAIRRLPEMADHRESIAAVAFLVERLADELATRLAREMEADGSTRLQALRLLLRSLLSEEQVTLAAEEESCASGLVNDLKTILAQPGDPELLSSLSDKHQASGRFESYRDLALSRRRNLPNLHVLTTLGPGETDTYIRNWLEESMALFNVTRARGLEEKVNQRVEEYRSRVLAAARRLVDELDLEGDLSSIIEEEGLDPDREADRETALLKLVLSYPEVGEEVSRLGSIAETQGEIDQLLACRLLPTIARFCATHPEWETEAVNRVVSENRLEKHVETKAQSEGISPWRAAALIVDENPDWRREKESHLYAEARRKIVADLDLKEEAATYLKRRLPNMHAVLHARREVIAESGRCADLEDARYRYEATGPFKRYNLLYTPSRVDLGAQEVHSVRNVPKWVGGIDVESANSGRSFYGLYNMAGVTAVDSPRLAEFLKVGENFFSRGGVYYLSLTAGVNIDTLGIGDFEFFRTEWNLRGDRMVLPTGETYGGFCVPKEFSLLHATIAAALRSGTPSEVLNSFGVPVELREAFVKDLRGALRLWTECGSVLEWEEKARSFLEDRVRSYTKDSDGFCFAARLPRLALTLQQLGVLSRDDEAHQRTRYEFAHWVNKKAHGLEEINRVGPFRKIHLIHRLLAMARERNPLVAGDGDCIGVIGASYKEGERIAGKEIPITDVRFSAGARKLAIYAGIAATHLVHDLDPDGRELVQHLTRNIVPPADVRLVGRCTGSDILNYVPGSGLEEAKQQVLTILQDAGLTDNVIQANCEIYGGDLKSWVGIKDLPEEKRKQVLDRIGSRIHLLVIERRGPFRTYREALQGADFVDLGIPDPELLDLIDDLPQMVAIMRRGRPASALVFADGTSGGRRRAFSYRYASSERKVKELLALEPNAVYGALGLGQETIEVWRSEMESDRTDAVALLEALRQKELSQARRVYERIRERIIRDRRADRAATDEIRAREAGCSQRVVRSYHLVSMAMSLVKRGLGLGSLDFGTWLLLGGMYRLNGKHTRAEINRLRKEFESLVAVCECDRGDLGGLAPELVEEVIDQFVRPRYAQPKDLEYRELSTGIEGSLKAVEEQVSRLARRAARRRQTRLANRQRRQRRAFLDESPSGETAHLYAEACRLLGDGESSITPETYGKYLAWASSHISRTAQDLVGPDQGIAKQIEDFLGGGTVSREGYLPLAHSLAKAAEAHNGDRRRLEQCAQALELMDRVLLIEQTNNVDNPDEMMVQLARYFDTTVNSHIFDYIPYHYHKQRSASFESLSRAEKIDLAARHHRWLYRYARKLMLEQTCLAETDEAYQAYWIGDATRGWFPIGVRGESESERFWFSYARLRDACVLVHEGFPLPELFLDVSPESLLSRDRPTVAIVYPYGNTTVPVALEQGPRLAEQQKVNLILTAFPSIGEHRLAGRQVVWVHDGLMFLSAWDFERLLRASGRPAEEVERRCAVVGQGGVFAALQLACPVVADAVFFHFTHPLRPAVGEVGCPLIQPILWEAATHLKCRLPDMLKGSGVRTADQFNWHKHERATLPPQEGLAEVERRLAEFAEDHPTVIVKPEKESGGRRAKILPIRRDGELLRPNIRELAELIYDISKTDNVVVQAVIPSPVRQLFTRRFLEGMVDRFARIGVTCHLDREPQTPLFGYFREIVVRGAKGYEISHHIVVLSTAGIANVGQGGLLYEYTDEIIHPKYRRELRCEITRAALDSLQSQQKYIREHWREILDEYLDVYPEFRSLVPRRLGRDLTGTEDSDIPYEMGDYMPWMLVDEEDNYRAIYDRETEQVMPLYNPDGSPTDVEIFDEKRNSLPRVDRRGKPILIPAFDQQGRRLPRFDQHGQPLKTLVIFKIESNPGAGLWRPHNDQLPPDRKGEGVYTIFRCLGERARLHRERLSELCGTAISAAAPVPPGPSRFISCAPTTDLVERALRLAEREISRQRTLTDRPK